VRHAAASIPQISVGVAVGPRLPLSLIPVADLLEQAALARRLASFIPHDPAAPRLEQFAEELEAEIARLSRLG
jgi:hypothetical protein